MALSNNISLETDIRPREIKTTCPYCGVGCGVDALVRVKNQQQNKPDNLHFIESVSGTQNHPANLGRLCVKGDSLNLTTKSKNRVLDPRNKQGEISWDQALDTVAEKFQSTIKEHGPDSVAFYLSGQLLTEDYYVANKLMKGFIGSANVDTNSRLCMASAVVGYKRAFGADAVPCNYEDLELADLIILIGSNAAWTHPVLYQRMVAAKQKRPDMKVVLIDPRKTVSADIADLHLPIKAAADGYLFQGLLHYLNKHDFLDEEYINNHTNGFSHAKDIVEACSLEYTATQTGLQIEDLVTFFNWFAQTEKTISFYSQGINQSSSGSDKCNDIINCHLATGKIGKLGAGPFSITGQPNAMGGREVGGLANQLAAHMDFEPEDVQRVQRFWQSPVIADKPGLKAVDLFDAIHAGKIKAVWVMATNPAVSLPNSEHAREALKKCDFVVVSDYVENDTSHYADIMLPTSSWGEKEGMVTNSERRISRQRALTSLPGQAKHDWWQLSQVAHRMGFKEHFDYQSPADIFREHAALSGFEQDQRLRDFDISAFAEITDTEYQEFTPIQWPVNNQNPNGTERLFTDDQFFTDDRKARFITNEPYLNSINISQETPLLLNTGRIRDQWHTMTRTGTAAKLLSHIDAPFIEVHPNDIRRYQLEDGELAKLSNEFGEFVGHVMSTDNIQVGHVFAPIHWTDQFAKSSIISAVVSPVTDPYSGQPESKATPVKIAPINAHSWCAVAVSQDCSNVFSSTLESFNDNNKADECRVIYWSKTPAGEHNEHDCFSLAANEQFDREAFIQSLIDAHKGLLTIRFSDELNRDHRIALISDDKKSHAEILFYSHKYREQLPSKVWLASKLKEKIEESPYSLVLGEQGPIEKIVCTCFQVSEASINEAIIKGCDSPEALSKELKCGSNCGSCIPELKELIKQAQVMT